MKIFHTQRARTRGFTLVELMIVVAIIGILAAIGGVAYTKYVKSAKITQLKQYAMEVASAQEQYKSQNSGYFNPSNPATPYAEGNTEWERLLGFSKKGLAAQGITVFTEAGGASGTCSICDGVDPSFNTIWYAVRVRQDFKTGDDKATTIILHNELPGPVLLNEGM